MKQEQNKEECKNEGQTCAPSGVNEWFSACTKNIEALTQASRMSAEVCQGLTRLQSEYMKQMMSDLGKITQDLAKPGSIKEKLQKHSQVARQNAEKTTEHAKTISKTIQENAKSVSKIMQGRIQETMKENRQHFEKLRKKAQDHDMLKHWSQHLHSSTATKN